MRYHPCACCQSPGVEPDFRYCGSCEGLRRQAVTTPLGPGIVDALRPTGAIIVELDTGVFRQFARSQITPAPHRASRPAPSPPAIPQPTPRPELPTADRTTDCRPLADPDPLARYRRALLQRSFGPAAFAQAVR